ncbi:MAG: hypothetical protein IT343_24055 [Candidatus Melainabacteria bacterium]|nr:hypothetical protein [Candidatus Melainabacteria bacterium]
MTVAPPLVEVVYVVPAVAIVTTAAEDVAVTPIAARLVSAFIAFLSPVAMLVSVLPPAAV